MELCCSRDKATERGVDEGMGSKLEISKCSDSGSGNLSGDMLFAYIQGASAVVSRGPDAAVELVLAAGRFVVLGFDLHLEVKRGLFRRKGLDAYYRPLEVWSSTS